MSNIEFENNVLNINNTRVEFIYEIRNVVEFNEKIFALIDSPPKSKFYRNIYCIDYNGKIIWQIDEPDYLQDHDRPFTGLWIDENELIAYNWTGVRHKINIESGKLDNGEFVK